MGVPAGKTHDLVYLLHQLASRCTVSDKLYEAAEALTGYAVEVRYPTHRGTPSAHEAQEAVHLAEEIRRFVVGAIGELGASERCS